MKSASKEHVVFLMPGPDGGPIGGYKIVYEYANRLACDGWDITIVYPLTIWPNGFVRTLIRHLRSHLIELWRAEVGAFRQRLGLGRWFRLDPRVKTVYPISLTANWLSRFDMGTKFIATYVSTVEVLNKLPRPAEDKINFIQGYEAWFGRTADDIDATYRYSMKKIAISEWLVDKVRAAGGDAVCVPNGLDFDYFKLTTPIESRKPTEVAMLWHTYVRKRTEDAVAALRMVKERHPKLHVTAFGASAPPVGLPDWITYVQRPDRERHNEIYNSAAIFVASSEQEGWGLTASEAMICGAAVACTDIGGYRSFAEDGVTALMSPVRNPEALAKNVIRLMEDRELRIRMAKSGREAIHEFTWDNSLAKLKSQMGHCS